MICVKCSAPCLTQNSTNDVVAIIMSDLTFPHMHTDNCGTRSIGEHNRKL